MITPLRYGPWLVEDPDEKRTISLTLDAGQLNSHLTGTEQRALS